MPGDTHPAGQGVDDAEMSREVADQTSKDLKAEDVFERESGGAATDAPADRATGDDLGR